MSSFEFATAGRIIFGRGTVSRVAPLAASFGQRTLLVTGATPARAEFLLATLSKINVTATCVAITREPTIEDITRSLARARAERCDSIIGFGGGSVLDAAKAIAALITNSGDLLDYLEVIGRAQPLHQPSAPCIAVPTTAGTGSEVTRNAVLASPAHRVKVSLRSPHMLPCVAVIDPDLTLELSPALTATTGMDALTQLIEPYVSSRANPVADAFCVDGLRRVSRSLRIAVQNGHDPAAREDMALASLFGGLALANSGLGAVHGLAGPIGGMFPAPHGAICAALLPHVMETNLRALRSRASSHDVLRRYEDIARVLTGRTLATSDDGVTWIRDLVAALQIPPLATYGITRGEISLIVEAAGRASSMKANPIPLTVAELSAILEHAL